MAGAGTLQRASVTLRLHAGGKTKAGDAGEALREAFAARLAGDLARISAELYVHPPIAIEAWFAVTRTVNVTWREGAEPPAAVTKALARLSYVASVTLGHPIDGG